MLTFRFTGASGEMITEETLTTGMIGREVRLEFSEEWDAYAKTAVFMAGDVIRDVVCVSDVVQIPAEVLEAANKWLYVGVYGISQDGKVTPTIRAKGPLIEAGAEPSGDAGTDPTLPVWAQLQQELDALKKAQADMDSRIGSYYIPEITQPTAQTIEFVFSPSSASMPQLEAMTVELPDYEHANADWGCNDGAKPSHVRNRTHWQDGENVYPLAEKFIPAAIARKATVLPMPGTAQAGQFIRVSAVDEKGIVTATECISVGNAEEVRF